MRSLTSAYGLENIPVTWRLCCGKRQASPSTEAEQDRQHFKFTIKSLLIHAFKGLSASAKLRALRAFPAKIRVILTSPAQTPPSSRQLCRPNAKRPGLRLLMHVTYVSSRPARTRLSARRYCAQTRSHTYPLCRNETRRTSARPSPRSSAAWRPHRLLPLALSGHNPLRLIDAAAPAMF